MIERVGWFWIDENGNKWNARYFSKEEALDSSKSLINCKNCKIVTIVKIAKSVAILTLG